MPENVLTQGKILIVDDELPNVRLLEIILSGAGYTNVHSTTDARKAIPLFCSVRPDIVLLDLAMPYQDGFAIMRGLKTELASDPVPILILTADATSASKHKALTEGAKDFLTKPLDSTEVLLRINNLLETRLHHLLLEAQVRERTRDLAKAQLETLQRLAAAAEYRDDDTGLHTKRVGVTAGRIAETLKLPAGEVELLTRAAPLHDVGKIGIADGILLKPGKLTDDEFSTIQQHTVIGAEMLAGSTSPWLQMSEVIALTHHERWNGRGYPNKMVGEQIPLIGRIVAVADVFDALTHERPYKKAWPVADAVVEIKAQSGQQFDEQVVQAFLTLPHEALI